MEREDAVEEGGDKSRRGCSRVEAGKCGGERRVAVCR